MASYKHKKTGRWVAQIYDPALGKKRQLGTFATKKEADARVRVELGKKPRSAMTISEWRDVWLENGDWKDATREHYAERTAAFEKAYGKTKLVDFDRTMARAYLKVNRSSWDTLRIMFGAAQHEDNEHGGRLLTDNPYSKLVKKTNHKRDLQADWLRPEDVDHLERCALRSSPGDFGIMLAAMVRVAAETGMRPGELFGLQHDDLDYENGIVTVRRAVSVKGKIDTPKNGKGREIVFSKRAQLAVQSVARIDEKDLVFFNTRGDQWRHPSWSHHWKPIRVSFGRPRMAWYELRHYCCTRLLELGVPAESAAIQLGHTDGGDLVRRVYGHESNRRALDNVRRAMDGDAGATPPAGQGQPHGLLLVDGDAA
jgi:integrase